MSELYLSLLLFAYVSTISPGGATTLATASGMQFGYVKSLPMIFGMVTGLAILIGSSALGLATLLLAIPVLSLLMKLCGSAYLLWLAYKIGSSGAPQNNTSQNASPIGFIAGFFLVLVNPKAWAMAFGASASFSTLVENPVELALIMGATFGAGGAINLSLWCIGGALLARILQTEKQWRILNISLALMLALAIVPFWIN